jgi:hypothetical protein
MRDIMKKIALSVVFFGLIIYLHAQQTQLVQLSEAQIIFASSKEAVQYLKSEDVFLQNLSPFDRSARLKTRKNVSAAEYVKFMTAQTLNWNSGEKQKINDIMQRIISLTSSYKLLFPKEIVFVKTTGKEEGNAAYCRGTNVIVLPSEYAALPADRLYRLVFHELFHIFSRNNPEIQEQLYGIISFKKCRELKTPDDLFKRKITNPDAVSNNYCFSSTINGKTYDLMPILLSSSDYDEKKGGEFFDYLELYFIAVTDNGTNMVPLLENNKYVLLTLDEVPGYMNMVGKNTDYIIHPEEIMADNFVLLMNNAKNRPSMDLLEKMKKILLMSNYP